MSIQTCFYIIKVNLQRQNEEIVMKHVFIVGSKCIGMYGGYETFVKKLLECHKDNHNIQYYIACKANGDGFMDISKLENVSNIKDSTFNYYNTKCFMIKIPEWLGSVQAIYYDIAALELFCKYIQHNQIKNPIVYILACRIGPFVQKYSQLIHKFDGKLYINPDGHEWKRTKWSMPVRRYWKKSECLMVKHADLVICDSFNIENYIRKSYQRYKPKTVYIAYGADICPSGLPDNNPQYIEWLKRHKVSSLFYLLVSRCVPENNYEVIIKEFMKSHTPKDLIIISTGNPRLLKELESTLHYKSDQRIKFVGTVYDQLLLKKIREKAYGYIHGHSVGGTNPSLLEALGSTKINLLYNIGFNKEVAEDSALYWSAEDGNLSELIDYADNLSKEERNDMSQKAKQRIIDFYSWQHIANEYLHIF